MSYVDNADVVIGLAWGDEGKGKVVSNLLASKNNYDFVCRFNGGPNAGHTIHINGRKYKTHLVPGGIFYQKPSYIGPGCVVNVKKLKEEFDYLKSCGFNTDLVKVHPNAHIITDEHIAYDKEHLSKLGTTGQGIAPCYADKMLRKGIRARDVLPASMLWDRPLEGNILAEGAQSVWLDPDIGDYPYVTSSSTLPYYACSLGFHTRKIGDIIGVVKAYDTKSGVDPLFPETLFDDPILAKIGELGGEYGTTTGRRRLVNYLNMDRLISAIEVTGVTNLVINKIDVLSDVNRLNIGNPFQLKYGGITFSPKPALDNQSFYDIFRAWIRETISEETTFDGDLITFSRDPEYVITPGHCECGHIFVDPKGHYLHLKSCPSCDLYFDKKFLL